MSLQLGSQTKNIELNDYQFDFIFSKSSYPAMVAGWGTGKSMCAILRAKLYSDLVPNNLGLICRKEKTDLKDSTMKDWEEMTGIPITGGEARFANGSVVMFRHIEELIRMAAGTNKSGANLQNINLGWFMIEQAEELLTDRAFWLLHGRLRRNVTPTQQFKDFKLPYNSGWCIANACGHNWLYNLYHTEIPKEFEGLLHWIEAKTSDNAHNLPQTFMENLELVRLQKPEMYARYVMNDHTAEVEANVFRKIENCYGGELIDIKAADQRFDYVLGLDLAKVHDFNVMLGGPTQTRHVDIFQRWNKVPWSQTKAIVKAVNKALPRVFWVMDATGMGDPIVEDLAQAGLSIYPFKFTNESKCQLIEKLVVSIEQRLISWPGQLKVLNDELKLYQALLSAARHVKYDAPAGDFDDTVIALALWNWGLFGEIYEPQWKEPVKESQAEEFWNRVRGQVNRETDNIEVTEAGARTL